MRGTRALFVRIVSTPLVIRIAGVVALILAIVAGDDTAYRPANATQDIWLAIGFLAVSAGLFSAVPWANRNRLKAQVAQVLPRVLAPEETVLAGAASALQTAPRQWELGEAIRRFRAAETAPIDAKPYFVLVTDQRIHFLRMIGSKLGSEAFFHAFSDIAVIDTGSDSTEVRLTLRRPDGTLVLLTFRRLWRKDGRRVQAAVAMHASQAPGGSAPG